jgi:aminopeptidase N
LRQAFEDHTGRSLERFFYDWTERPGAPAVTVSYEWLDEDRLAKVSARQTQEADVFHFPLEVEFHFSDGLPVSQRADVSEREQVLYFSLRNRPTMVLVDPRQAVLMELKENKGRDLWATQLVEGPGAIDRIRAARSLGESKSPQDVRLLGRALLDEGFWGVSEVIAEALGTAGGESARDALLAALAAENPRVRREVVERLGSFAGDAKAIDALRELIAKGDPSYRVEAAAIEAYAKLKPPDAASFLPQLLDRPSHLEQIRAAALSGLGLQPDAAGLDTLIEWTRRGKPRECRAAAIEGLGELAKNERVSEETRERVISVLTESLKDERPRFQRSAVAALAELGDRARPALPALRDLAANGEGDRIRKAAADAAEKIAAAAPAQVQAEDLREDLAKLRDEARRLQERIERLEAHFGSKLPAEAASGGELR